MASRSLKLYHGDTAQPHVTQYMSTAVKILVRGGKAKGKARSAACVPCLAHLFSDMPFSFLPPPAPHNWPILAQAVIKKSQGFFEAG